MDTKHTPGPWEWIGSNLEAGRNDVLRVGDDGKEYGLHSAVLFEDDDPVRAQANRDLIAAAPDLLAALEEARNGLEWYQASFPNVVDGSDHEAMERINAAITKATGAA